MIKLILILLILFGSLNVSAGEMEVGGKIPAVRGKTLSGIEATISEQVRGEITLLIVTFKKSSAKPAREWSERFLNEYSNRKTANVMQLMFLQSVPRLLRGMVTSGIKKGMPKHLYERTLLIYEKEKEWKELLKFSDKDDLPFLILLNRDGTIEWRHHKSFSQSEYDQLILKTNGLIDQK